MPLAQGVRATACEPRHRAATDSRATREGRTMVGKANGSKEELIQGLQEDLAREYKAIIQYVIYSQKLTRAQYMDIAAELEKHAHEELDHALQISKQLDYFDAYPTHEPKPVQTSEDNEDMLWFDLDAEDETVRNYRQRIRRRRASASTPWPKSCARSSRRSRTTRSISPPRWASPQIP